MTNAGPQPRLAHRGFDPITATAAVVTGVAGALTLIVIQSDPVGVSLDVLD